MSFNVDFSPEEYLERRISYYEKKIKLLDVKLRTNPHLIIKHGDKLNDLIDEKVNHYKTRIIQYQNAIIKLI